MKYIKNTISGFVMAALVLTLIPAGSAHGQTTADLQAQIAALLAQVNALTAQLNAQGGAAVTTTFTRDLTLGSTGADVQALQRFLNTNGYPVAAIGAGSPGNESTYFGALTKAALARFQASKNIFPAVGYFGPITRSAVNAMVGTGSGGTGSGGNGGTTPPPSNDNALKGGAGSIEDADFISSLNNEEVGEGEEDVEVAGLKIEADQGSDIMLTAVRLVFTQGTADRRFDRYADEVSLWFNGKEVARADADEFNRNNNYSRTLSLKSGAIIRLDKTGELVIAISGINNLDSSDAGETWRVEFDTVRFQDAQGAVISDTSTGDIGATRTFSFEDFATASDVELEVVETGTNPKGRIIEASASSRTNNVLLLAGEFRNNGDSDIEIRELQFSATSTGTGDVQDIVQSFILKIDGDTVQSIGSAQCTGAFVCVFDDVDFMLDAGDEVSFEIRADLNRVDGTNVAEGDSVTLSVDADDIVAEDEQGNDLSAADLKGSVAGKAQVLYTVFPEITLVGSPVISYVGDNTANANVSFKVSVRARGGTIYLNGHNEATAADETFQANVLGGDGNTVLTSLIYTPSGSYTRVNSGADNEYYVVNSGQTMQFTLNGSLSQSSTTVVAGAEIAEIQFGTSATDQTTRSARSITFDDLLDQLETSLLTLIGA